MKKLVFSFAAFLGLSIGAMAQTTATHGVDVTIQSVALLSAVGASGTGSTAGNSSITIGNPDSDVVPGAIPKVKVTDGNTLWLQYTSIQAGTGTISTPRTIKASVPSTSAIPAGISITASSGTPTGTGNVGTGLVSAPTIAGGPNVPNNTPLNAAGGAGVTIISGIGSGYTGTSSNNGANITYSAAITTVEDLVKTGSTPPTVVVLYTLSQE